MGVLLASILIFFRESLEAAMICAIMLSYLKKIGRRDHFKEVWVGIGLALGLDILGGIVIFTTIHRYDGSMLQTQIEGMTYFIACGVLTYMTFWMKKQGRHLKSELQSRIQDAVSTGSLAAIVFIAFITVGREGLETVIFMIAIAFHSSPLWLTIGAIVGTMLGLLLSYFIYVLGKRINLGYFFHVMGILLMFFAAGLLANGIEDFQQLGWLPRQHALWSSATFLSENSTFGDILHSFFGYADSPTSLQVMFYLGFLVVVMLFWKKGNRKSITDSRDVA